MRREPVSRGVDWHNLVVAVDDQRRNVELRQILGEVRLRERLDALILVLETTLHPLKPEGVADALGDLGTQPVGTVDWFCEILEELRAVGRTPARMS